MPRIHYPGALYHVMLRGNGGTEIFTEDPNRQYFEALVAEGVARFGHRIHAYCWMSNHVHLALQVADIPLSKITQNLAFHYTRWFNKQHCRQGHLFQGRHKAILVDQDAYLLQLVRYIYLNPVRVGLVSNPCAYPWSGHLGYLGERRIDWLSTDWVLSQFAPYKALARRRYERYVLAGTKEGHRNEFHTGSEGRRLLEDDRFIKRVFKDQGERCGQHLRTLDLKRLVEILCEELDVEPATLAQPGKCREAAAIRKWITFIYWEWGGTPTEAAKYFNRDITTLGNAMEFTYAYEDSPMVRHFTPHNDKTFRYRDGCKATDTNGVATAG